MPRSLSPDEIESFRSQLCDVATRQFAEAGYEGVTLRRLAAALGVSAMTPYRYFRNKGEIFEAVRGAAFERFGDHVSGVHEATRALPGIEQLRAAGRAYVAFALKEPHAYRIMFEIDHLELDEAFREKSLERCWRPLLEITERCIREGSLAGDPLTIAHLCWITLHGLVTLHLSNKLQNGRSLEALLEPTLDSILRGAAPTSPSAGAPR